MRRCGGDARISDQDLANYQTALMGLCQALDMLPDTPPSVHDVRYGGNAIHMKGPHRRLLASAGGTHQPLGEIIDIYGDTVETTTCAFERGWIGSIRRPFMPIYAGDQVIELVETVSGAG